MRRILLSEIHETEALSPKSSAASTITFLNQKDSSPSSTISVICLVISVLALITVFLGILHLIFKILRKSPTFFQIRDFNSNSDLSSSSSPQLQHLFFLHDSGLDQTAVDALPVFIYGDIIMSLKEPFDCAVCLSEFSDSDKLRLLPVCRHAFHLHCIDTWLLANSTCPLCRLSLSASNDAETSIAVPLFDHQHVDEGKASLSERVFSVRLGRFNSTNESQRHEVKGELGMGVPRRCYSMGTRKFLECDQDFVVASREGKTSNNCSGHEGKSVRQDSGGLGSRKESMSVSKIWLWSDKNKRTFQHSLV